MTVSPPPPKAELANLGYSRVMEGRKRMKQMGAGPPCQPLGLWLVPVL